MITTRIQTTTRLFIATLSLAAVAVAFRCCSVRGRGRTQELRRGDRPAVGPCRLLRTCLGGRRRIPDDLLEHPVHRRHPEGTRPLLRPCPTDGHAAGLAAQHLPPRPVVRGVPSQNHGAYSVQLQGYFVFCSGQGIVSGACVPSWTSMGEDQLPFAETVNGQALTSTEAIESAADAGDVALVNLGAGAVLIGTITRGD